MKLLKHQFHIFPQCFLCNKWTVSKWLLGNGLTFKVLFTTKVAFIASVDQDQAAQNMQPDL